MARYVYTTQAPKKLLLEVLDDTDSIRRDPAKTDIFTGTKNEFTTFADTNSIEYSEDQFDDGE